MKATSNSSTLYTVNDGGEVIKYLTGIPPYDDRARCPLPGLILLDLRMPKFSGFYVLEWLQKEPSFAKIARVVFSTSSNQADIDKAYDLGAAAFITKPYEVERMLTLVPRLLSLAHGSETGTGKYGNEPRTAPRPLTDRLQEKPRLNSIVKQEVGSEGVRQKVPDGRTS